MESFIENFNSEDKDLQLLIIRCREELKSTIKRIAEHRSYKKEDLDEVTVKLIF